MVKRLLDRGILDVIGHRAFGVVVVLVIVVFLALAWMDRGLDRSVSRAKGLTRQTHERPPDIGGRRRPLR
jgi:hypothetical protein